MHEQKGIQKEYNGTERGIRGDLRGPGKDLQNGAAHLVPAAFGQGGGFFEQDLPQGQPVSKRRGKKPQKRVHYNSPCARERMFV